MQFCKDCKHYWPVHGDARFYGPSSYCMRPTAHEPSPVTGRIPSLCEPAISERKPRRMLGRIRCGPCAVFFEPASGMEARQGGDRETGLHPKDDSPTPKGDAQ